MKLLILASAAMLGSASALFVPATIPPGSASVAPGPSVTVTVVAETTAPSRPGAKIAAAAAYSCPSGQYLTYGVGSEALPGVSLGTAQAYFNNWSNDGPGPHISSTGSGSPGATRAWTFVNSDIQSNFQVNEVLNTVITPTGGNSNLEQKYSINNKEYYYSGNLVLYQAYKDLTVGENSSGQVFVQLYMNVCANNQQLALKALPTIITQSLNYWKAHASSGNPCAS